MKVSELIEKLSVYDPDLEVYVFEGEFDYQISDCFLDETLDGEESIFLELGQLA